MLYEVITHGSIGERHIVVIIHRLQDSVIVKHSFFMFRQFDHLFGFVIQRSWFDFVPIREQDVSIFSEFLCIDFKFLERRDKRGLLMDELV